MIIAVPLKPQNYKSSSLTFKRVLEQSVHGEFSLLESQKKLTRQLLVPVSFVVTSTHLLDHLVVPHLENSA